MLEFLANKSASLLLSRSSKQDTDKSVYTYGFSLLYSSCFIIFTILLLSWLIGDIKYGIYFFLVFIPLRSYSGGYHSESYNGCFWVSNVCFLSTYFLAEVVFQKVHPLLLLMIIFVISIYILRNSPVEHKSHPISSELVSLYKFKAGMLLAIFFIVLIVLSIVPILEPLRRMASATLCMVALLIHIAIKKGEKRMTERIGKFIEKLSIRGAGNASAFIAYQPETPEALRDMPDYHTQKNSLLFRLYTKVTK